MGLTLGFLFPALDLDPRGLGFLFPALDLDSRGLGFLFPAWDLDLRGHGRPGSLLLQLYISLGS